MILWHISHAVAAGMCEIIGSKEMYWFSFVKETYTDLTCNIFFGMQKHCMKIFRNGINTNSIRYYCLRVLAVHSYNSLCG